MAYYCTIRTNYFHVKDEDAFRKLIGRAYGREDSIQLFEDEDAEGNPVFGFGLYGRIAGVKVTTEDGDEDFDESSYDEFLYALQECVAEGDAIIILEAGNDKLRFVVGNATIITSKDCTDLSLKQLAAQHAAAMLGNPSWETRCEY